jgi:VanZ family protein
MTRVLTSGVAWACLGFIIFATLSPNHLRPVLTQSEPVLVVLAERFGAFALLGCLFVLSYPNRVLFVCAVVFGAAIALEFAQIFIPDRDARLIDVAEKLAGGGAGLLAGQWMLRRLQVFG